MVCVIYLAFNFDWMAELFQKSNFLAAINAKLRITTLIERYFFPTQTINPNFTHLFFYLSPLPDFGIRFQMVLLDQYFETAMKSRDIPKVLFVHN